MLALTEAFLKDACFRCLEQFQSVVAEDAIVFIDQAKRLSRIPSATPEAKTYLSGDGVQVQQYVYENNQQYAYVANAGEDKSWIYIRQGTEVKQELLNAPVPLKMWYDFDGRLYLLSADYVRRYSPETRQFTTLSKVMDYFSSFAPNWYDIKLLHNPQKQSIHLYHNLFMHRVYEAGEPVMKHLDSHQLLSPNQRLPHVFDVQQKGSYLYAAASDQQANLQLIRSDLLGESEVIFNNTRYELQQIALAENNAVLFYGIDLQEGLPAWGLLEQGNLTYATTVPKARLLPFGMVHVEPLLIYVP